ncbi:deoxynucleoside kinase [Nitrosomonas sp. ANs5]|uniref:deoxynucleoside kinase n=1 Tax=Nitrosomonas sp. ANs5 TaxID=3423941 RepID=UPI003D338F4E
MSLQRYRYIAIEGPIGAGKTSLARNLADRLKGVLVLEQPEANPFLEKFYADMPRHALSTQLFFLFQRMQQLQVMRDQMFAQPVVSDFLFEKDQLFAEVTLSEAEHELYKQLRAHVQPHAAPPDLVIYLQAAPEILIRRIRQRGSVLEQSLSEDYLVRLSECYMRFFHAYDQAPVMIVNSEHLNFAHSAADLDMLLGRIERMRSAREYFNVGG